jgi:hypothetical protein
LAKETIENRLRQPLRGAVAFYRSALAGWPTERIFTREKPSLTARSPAKSDVDHRLRHFPDRH